MSYRGNGADLEARSVWVEFHKGTVKVTLTERVTLNRDPEKSCGLVTEMFEEMASRQNESSVQEGSSVG